MAPPKKYKPELHVPLAEAWCSAGLTDVELAKKFGVTEMTINNWKKEYPDFKAAMTRGKELPNSKVEAAVFKAACGFHVKAVKHLVVSDGSQVGAHVETIEYREYFPPNMTGAIFWLKNRDPLRWKDRIEHTGAEGGPIPFTVSFVEPNARNKDQ